ncbi:UDP-N-acetylmuramate dehydrogenase [Isosphaeraceae bacterium EP7]
MHSLDDFREIVRPAESLAAYTWLRLGGPAQFLAKPSNAEELAGLVARAREAGLPVRVLAGGSNILVRDEGVPGLVVHLESPSFSDVKVEGNRVEAGAAVPLTALISQTARVGLGGLELLTGIPGTLGGAIKGNSGGRQGAIGQFIRSITLLDSAGQIQEIDRDEAGFSYRKSDLDDEIVLSARLEFESEDQETVIKRMRRIWIIKKENQPYGHQSSGCIFKNPSPEVSAGMLIDQAGMRGARVGHAEVSDRHANYILAERGATSADVLTLIDQVRDRVRQQFGYDLELQIQVW